MAPISCRALRLPLAALVALAPTATAQDRGVPSTTGLVVSTSDRASDIGAEILHRGGNAVDAAVATAFALAVTHPVAGNIGGGGFMVIRLANGRATAIDYRERAPLRSTRTMYLDSTGQIARERTDEGYLAPGVPGTVRGLALAHAKYGRLPWRDLVLPAARLAEAGFPASADLAQGLNWLVKLTRDKYPATIAAYGRADGKPWTAGDTLRLPDLSRTLTAIAEQGPDAFYRGWIADRLVADMEAHGGIMSHEDLRAYKAVERAPVKGSFLGHEVLSMPPPSSGGVALVEMLNLLERFDLPARERYAPLTLHLTIEAMRRAFLDRALYLGDPDFVSVPVERLTSKTYAATLAAGIDTTRATSSVALAQGRVPVVVAEHQETTHFSVLDAEGNAVANTYTLEQGFGSRVVVAGAGFLLNNEMGDFNKKPGETNTQGDIGTDANLIAPGKRMLSSMTPTIVTRDGKVLLITGSPGGRTIINTVLQIVVNVLAFHMSAAEAVAAPRMHHQWLPDEVYFEQQAIPEATVAALQALGHKVQLGGRQGDGHSILVDLASGVAYGANDPRSPDSKAAK